MALHDGSGIGVSIAGMALLLLAPSALLLRDRSSMLAAISHAV
jgi:hypothetical protein